MDINQITDLVETRFLPLINKIKSSFDLKFGELNIQFTSSYVHVYYNSLRKNQFTCSSNNEWTCVQYCPNHLSDDDTAYIYEALLNIWENQIKESKLMLSKKQILQEKLKQIEKELEECN